MEITRGYRVRIYPNKEQEQYFLRTVGACRWVYNHFLEKKRDYYLEHNKALTYGVTSSQLTVLRKEVDWLSDAQFQPLQQSLRQLDVAYSNFFRKQARFPKFKSRRDSRQSFNKVTGWSIDGNKLSIVRGMSVRFRGTFPAKREGTLTISRDATGRWYASTLATIQAEQTKLSGVIGIDLGLTHLAITSDGDKYDNPSMAKKRAKRMKQIQQSLARKQQGSNRYAKAKLEVARLHRKVANQRINHLHQVSSAITSKNHALIAVEDLAVANMRKNHSLSGSITDVGWGELLKQLEYKQLWRGGQFVKIDRFFPSSKTCSECGFIQQDMPLSVRQWECPRCGAQHDRDINAAKNILKQAGERLGAESTDGSRKVRVTGSVKRGYVEANATHNSQKFIGEHVL